MGKPSSTSFNSKTRSTSNMNSNKRSKELQGQKKYHEKTKKNIMKLFNKIRDESRTSCSLSNESVIEVDDSPSRVGLKRKKSKQSNLRAKLQRSDNENHSVIIINDDELQTTLSRPCTPNMQPIMHCSTPFNNAKNTDILDISNVKPNNNSLTKNLIEINDLTKEVNKDSFITIDLTTETNNSTIENTVIDLANTSETQDCLLVSASNTSLSLSGESDVTVLKMKSPSRSSGRKLQKLAKGIPHLGPDDKRKLLELITQRILNGCNVPKKLKDTLQSAVGTETQATETQEDTYIKEVILGQKTSRNSIGSNIYNPEKDIKKKSGLRMIVIDGSNVAMEHYKGKAFSVKGLKICIEYFLNRGHIVKAFVPRFRCKFGKSTEPRLLDELERRGLVVYTPSREIHGKMIASYDDRYIVQCAAEFDGVIVSGDNYRDLLQENPRWRFIIENRLLPFTWVNDMIMFPRDPLGRYGPTLEHFLRHNEQ